MTLKIINKISDWNHWDNVEVKNLPIIIYGGDNAVYDDNFDSRNSFVKLIDCYSFPPVFKIQSLDGKHEIDRCFPLNYRQATALEVERLINPNSNI
jgi:hypothetical protein